VADARLVRRQLRTNGELLLRTTPPGAGSLRPVESSTWSEHWTAFYEKNPHLRPRLERSSAFPTAGLPEELAALLDPDREYVLVASLHDHPEAVGVGAATVAGPGDAVGAYLVQLVAGGHEDLFVLDEPAGTAVLVDQEADEDPGSVLLQRYRWPDVED
jgi:hypothetical protein